MMDIKVGIAAHKPYRIPEGDIYLPIQVGAAGKDRIFARVSAREGTEDGECLEMTGDDTGENISLQNPRYCELTGLYWMWKNLSCQYGGLVHYRRHFRDPYRTGKDVFSRILDRENLEKILEKTDIILPKKRNYYIESIYSHYAHSHYGEHLDVAREIISERCPEYLRAFDQVMRGKKAHMFNMMIMKKTRMDQYCSWLFPILKELDGRIDSSSYDPFQDRFPGRVSELLLDVWVNTNRLSYVELPVIMTEKVHWGRKIASFLRAKFFKKRYKRGF